MNHTNVSHQYDPNRLLDTLTKWLGLGSDKTLSRLLRVSPQVIRGIRSGRLPIRTSLLVAMAECVGTGVDELRVVLGDRRKKARMLHAIRGAEGKAANSAGEAKAEHRAAGRSKPVRLPPVSCP